jgi:hypothetical protein
MELDFDSMNPTFQDLGGYDRDPEQYEDTYDEDYEDYDDDEEYWGIKRRAPRREDYDHTY